MGSWHERAVISDHDKGDARGADGDQTPADAYARLEEATPEERAAMTQQLIADHPQGRLDLPARAGQGANLVGVALPGETLRKAHLPGANLHGANLSGAALGQADLTNAVLEKADLHDADLAGATLRGAALGEANLQGALLEEANLQDAGLRFANLRGAALESADLRRADLWGVTLDDADLAGADLTDAHLGESTLRGANFVGATLRGAALGKADLTGARLSGADLRGADLGGATLREAKLDGAQLQEVDLSTCDIAHIALGGAQLSRTLLRRDGLGGAIGEEVAAAYNDAATGYLALERNFADLGDLDAARWAYGKKRRMQKRAVRAAATAALEARQWGTAAGRVAAYVGDEAAEWLCDYGESVPRVLRALVVAYLAFTLFYGVTGSVVRVTGDILHPVRLTTHNPLDLAVFSLASMTTQTALGLQASDSVVQIPTGLETLIGIFLTGLLGFVTGNRIRR